MKEVLIKIRLENNQLATAMQIDGMKAESIEDKLILIGLLDNIKQMELNKLSIKASFNKVGDNDWSMKK